MTKSFDFTDIVADVGEETVETKAVATPRLDAIEGLYVKTYLATLSHITAHRTVAPTLKHHHENNIYSRRENVSYYISAGLQAKAEAANLNKEDIISLLLKEATLYGRGSNHAARIQALGLLGKHLNLFGDAPPVAPVYNIVNYSNSIPINNPSAISTEDKEGEVLELDSPDSYESFIPDTTNIPEDLITLFTNNSES